MKKLMLLAMVAMLAVAPSTQSFAQDKAKENKECCKKCTDKCKEACKQGKCSQEDCKKCEENKGTCKKA